MLLWRIEYGRDHEHYYYDISDKHTIITNEHNSYVLADDDKYPLAS